MSLISYLAEICHDIRMSERYSGMNRIMNQCDKEILMW